jgi:hypothetical protein
VKLKAALLTVITVGCLAVIYVAASLALAYPEGGFWLWVAAAIAVLAVSYFLILRMRGES